MATIKLTQWLCPERHCIFALLWDESETPESEVLEHGEALFAGGHMNRWCGICGQPPAPETGITKYDTIEAAMEPMREEEYKNEITRIILGGRF